MNTPRSPWARGLWRRLRHAPRLAGRRLSLRQKLLALVLLPLAVVLPLLGLLLLLWGNAAVERLLQTKVRSDLAVAEGYFERVRGEVGASVAGVAQSHELHLALADPRANLGAVLRDFKLRHRLDYLNLRDAEGRWLAGDSPQATRGLPFTTDSADPLGASLRLAEADELPFGDPALRARVAVPLVATRNAAPTQRQQEDRALLLQAHHRLPAGTGRPAVVLEGGLLLNRSLDFIDHINEIVYPEGSLPFGSRGTATLFLEDVRISTNVRLFGGESAQRAIGTRVSQQVRDAVLGSGSMWVGRAFVVNDWYVSGYLPLRDAEGRRVGMLYVGILEAPFTLLKYGALASIGVLYFVVMVGAAALSLRTARSVFAPMERMDSTMQKVQSGDLHARVGAVHSRDEVGRLARHLDELLGTQQRWHEALDAKVAERTAQLQATQQQLVRSEKLATIGQLTASIAHEVNNPIAVLQGNLDLLRELLPPDALAPVQGELKLMDEQIERMRLIVTQLLQFARPGEYAGYVQRVAPAAVLADCLVLVGHQLASSRIAVVQERPATQAVAINRQELQQVLVNLLVNAVHAMPEGGRLTLRCADAEPGWVHLQVQDSGPGLAPALLNDLFQPFVTGKKDGTGLGLWISRSLVERYGGDITAANAESGGAVFTVRLKAAP